VGSHPSRTALDSTRRARRSGKVLSVLVGAFDLEVKGEHRHWSEDDAFMIAQTRYEGVHRGQFLDYAPTDRPIRFPLAVVIPFRDGLMAGERFYYDLATLLRQIGVMPALSGE
jgi:hypothetical protein